MNASEIVGLLRFGIGVRRFVRTPISAATAKSIVLKNMQRRPQSLLKKIESAIFGYRNSPYLALLRHAGCELGDIRLMLDQDGVEGTLERLRDAGVYVTYEEYKGLASAVRGSARFDFRAKDFDNPFLTRAFRGSTGGSSGRLTHVWFDLDAIAQTAPHWGLWIDAHGWSAGDHPLVLWWPGHPGAANGILRTLKVGKPYKKWFVQVRPAVLRDRIAAAIIHALVRQAGGLTKPVFAPSTAVRSART